MHRAGSAAWLGPLTPPQPAHLAGAPTGALIQDARCANIMVCGLECARPAAVWCAGRSAFSQPPPLSFGRPFEIAVTNAPTRSKQREQEMRGLGSRRAQRAQRAAAAAHVHRASDASWPAAQSSVALQLDCSVCSDSIKLSASVLEPSLLAACRAIGRRRRRCVPVQEISPQLVQRPVAVRDAVLDLRSK